ncbi:hypothetical protein CEXT_496411 [Caerostris extrusa]|uniref:Uncharacterized protein n=1 Tax=Caerostris extrusa TaxID=172846 RepID=A0AAV4R535_CAEEX|nr:hypothetical protein CEXT_496411 [Caerostris extrusa]
MQLAVKRLSTLLEYIIEANALDSTVNSYHSKISTRPNLHYKFNTPEKHEKYKNKKKRTKASLETVKSAEILFGVFWELEHKTEETPQEDRDGVTPDLCMRWPEAIG